MIKAVFVSLCLWLCVATSAVAQSADANEQRARDIGAELRCVVCQNQSIEESDALLAQDMRRIVRTQIAAGQSDTQVIQYMRDRYGDYVLLKPPVQSNTLLLWALPGILVLLMGVWFLTSRRRVATTAPETPLLSAEDKALLNRILDDQT